MTTHGSPAPAEPGPWATPSADGELPPPRPGMRTHRQRPETKQRIARMALRRTLRSVATVAAGAVLIAGALAIGAWDAGLGMLVLFGIVGVVTMPAIAVVHHRSVRSAQALVVFADDASVVLRYPGQPDHEVRRASVTEVVGDGTYVRLFAGGRPVLVVDDGLTDWDALRERLEGWSDPGAAASQAMAPETE